MTAPGEPILECRPKLQIVPLRTQEPQSRVGVIFDEKTGILEWPIGPEGDRGPQGPASRPWRLVGYVTAEANLPTGLIPDDAGKAWANTDTKAVHIWQGHRWHDPVPTGLSRPGDAGPPVNLTAQAVTLDEGSEATGSITGDAPDHVLSVGLPRGPIGDQGPQSPPRLLTATDYVGLPPTRGQSLSWDAERSGRPAGWVSTRPVGDLGQWSITDAEFDTEGSSNGQLILIASTTLSPLAVPYRLLCTGYVAVRQGVRDSSSDPLSYSVTTITVEAEYGASGAIQVGYGRTVKSSNQGTLPGSLARFTDRVTLSAAYLSKLTPDSPVGVVPAGEPVAVTVKMFRDYNARWAANRVETGQGSNIQLTGIAI